MVGALVALGRAARGLRLEGQAGAREGGERRDPARLELAALEARHAGDEGEVIVVAPLPVAAPPPAADLALGDGLRVGAAHAARRVERLRERALHAAVVGHEVPRAEALGLAVARRLHHVHRIGEAPLELAHDLRVEAELEHRAALRLHRELRVDGLVGPGAELARRLHAQQHVRDAAPAPLHQRGLGDGADAPAHRVESGGGAGLR